MPSVKISSSLPQYAKVSAKHDTRPYVVVEKFENMLSSIACSKIADDSSATLHLSFKDTRLLKLAIKHWSPHNSLTFITHHHTCNDQKDRAAYISSAIHFDELNLVAFIEAQVTTFGLSPDLSSSLRITGGSASKNLAESFNYRKYRTPQSKRSREEPPPISFDDSGNTKAVTLSIDKKWGDWEEIFNMGGFSLTCANCHAQGELRTSFALSFRTDILNQVPTSFVGISQDELIAKFCSEATLTMEVVKEIDISLNLNFILNTGALFRFPSIVPNEDPAIGNNIFKSTSSTPWQFGPLALELWAGTGVMPMLTVAGELDIKSTLSAKVPVGKRATIDLLNTGNNFNDIFPTVDAKSEITKTTAKGCLGVGYMVAADIGFRLHLPGQSSLALYSGAAAELPSISYCAAKVESVNENCEPGGTLSGVETAVEVGFGVYGYAALAPYIPYYPIARFRVPEITSKLPKEWYNTWKFDHHCSTSPSTSPSLPEGPSPPSPSPSGGKFTENIPTEAQASSDGGKNPEAGVGPGPPHDPPMNGNTAASIPQPSGNVDRATSESNPDNPIVLSAAKSSDPPPKSQSQMSERLMDGLPNTSPDSNLAMKVPSDSQNLPTAVVLPAKPPPMGSAYLQPNLPQQNGVSLDKNTPSLPSQEQIPNQSAQSLPNDKLSSSLGLNVNGFTQPEAPPTGSI
ncbi:MAG: hypothetical protein M1829_006121 [Trizodia sp. TS-e1964]|nr:MAG: hypothetical protein M1829_006121 [Trizodia sp. TS-e1964]